MANKKDAPDPLTRFERAVVFRVARGYFFAMAVLAVVIFVGGAVVGVRSLSAEHVPQPVSPRPPAARPQLDLNALVAEVDRQRARATQAASTIELKPPAGQAARATDPGEDQFDLAVRNLRAAFPDPPYSWENEVERTCSAPTAFGCLQWGTRVKRYGVAGVLSKAFEGMDRGEVIDYLGILSGLLQRAPVERRLELVLPIIQAEREARAAHKELLAKHERALEKVKERHESALSASKAKQMQWRQFGLYGLATGFALLITVSLFLAFLSMERHTRALEALVRRNLPPDDSSAADPDPA